MCIDWIPSGPNEQSPISTESKLLNSSTTNGYTESRYSFDHVYDESISNEQIYVDNILPYLQNCIENV